MSIQLFFQIFCVLNILIIKRMLENAYVPCVIWGNWQVLLKVLPVPVLTHYKVNI